MTAQTQTKYEIAIDRVLNELKVDDYESFIASFEDEILQALCRQLGLVRILPQAGSIKTFNEARRRIATRKNVSELLKELKEPTPEELRRDLQFFRELPARLKASLNEMNAQIRPHGGPEEKFSDPVEIYSVTDEIFDRLKRGQKLTDIKKDITKRKKISLSTLDRRLREELERRSQLEASEKQTNEFKID